MVKGKTTDHMILILSMDTFEVHQIWLNRLRTNDQLTRIERTYGTKMSKILHLQGFRGLAIIAVVLFHFFPLMCPNGYLGVDMFFVLSGYLMAMMMSRVDKTTWSSVGEFLYRRVKRIAPLYYLVIVVTNGAVYFCTCLDQNYNLFHGMSSLLMMIRPTIQELDYFAKLVNTKNFFTHTWSICIEMQFYLVFPLIWILQSNTVIKWKQVPLFVICISSFVFYYTSEEKKAFSDMFARIWQFLLGTILFLQQTHHDLEEKELLIKSETNRRRQMGKILLDSLKSILILIILLFLIYCFFTSEKISATLSALLIVHFGAEHILLENAVIVFLGEISYSWYLVHWPLFTAQKVFFSTTLTDTLICLAVSFIIAVLLYFTFEKQLLSWNKGPVLVLVVALFGCGLFIQHYIEDKIRQYNLDLEAYDLEQLVFKDCVSSPPTFSWGGTCKFTDTKETESKRLQLVGNSWTANAAHITYEECRGKIGEMFSTAFAECEVLYRSEKPWCPRGEKIYFDAVEELRPDYLFVITRHVDLVRIKDEKEEKDAVDEMIRRLEKLSQFVKERIFILHVFSSVSVHTSDLSRAMDTGEQPKFDLTLGGTVDYDRARKNLEKAVSHCPKCSLFDYMPDFVVNGTFYPYDPHYFVPYVTYSFHLSLPALEKIRHVYTDLCNKL